MSNHDQDRISARAYALWEAEGGPEGKALDHWSRALKELGDVNGENGEDAEPSATGPCATADQTDGPDKIPLYP